MKLRQVLETTNVDIVTVTIPLLIKLLEWAREEASDDIEIHKLIEKLTQHEGTIDTAAFDALVTPADEKAAGVMEGIDREYGVEEQQSELQAAFKRLSIRMKRVDPEDLSHYEKLFNRANSAVNLGLEQGDTDAVDNGIYDMDKVVTDMTRKLNTL